MFANNSDKSEKNRMMLMIGLVLLGVGFVYYFYNYNNSEGNLITSSLGIDLENIVQKSENSKDSEGLDLAEETNDDDTVDLEFLNFDTTSFSTDYNNSSIDTALLLSGGPGKDGIPSIDEPKFVSVAESEFDDDSLGILVDYNGDKRYYPYPIIVWHEIINDTVGDKDIAVTFCPLCGSAIVFNRSIEGDVLDFGVSGLLYESNLVMYDRQTESFWSQAKGESIVGEYNGTELEVLPMQLITFGDIKTNHRNAQVLSTDTGELRDYSKDPYTGYEDTNELYFPVSVQDKRFPPKELMYVVPIDDGSLAMMPLELEEGVEQTIEIDGIAYTASRAGSEIIVTDGTTDYPGYYEMWFSWSTHHQDDGVVWEFE